MAYVRKSLRASNPAASARFARSTRIALQALSGPQYEEQEIDGAIVRVRQWGDGNEDWVTPEDVRNWLTGRRVVLLSEGLEFCREAFIKGLVRDGYLRKDAHPGAGFYWVTAKAAEKFNLPRVMGCKFPA
jgi:hypothetical protein